MIVRWLALFFLFSFAALAEQPQSYAIHFPDLNPQDAPKIIVAGPSNVLFVVSSATKTTTITDIHVTKTDSRGNLLGSFDFGSSGIDTPNGAAVDAQGNLVIVGGTQSSDFPLVSAAQTTGAMFVTKVDSQLSHIVFSTRFGGPADSASAVAADLTGNFYVTGATAASVTTTPGVFQPQAPTITPPATLINGFVSEFSPAGRLVYSTYFGASGYTCYQAASPCLVIIGPHGTTFGAAVFTKPTAIAVDSTGAVVIAGATNANNLPFAASAYSQQCGCNNLSGVAFVAKISTGGATVLWGTYVPPTQLISQLPGTVVPSPAITGVALDSAGNVVLTGNTPQYFPVTPGAVQTAFPVPSPDLRSSAGFVAKLDNAGSKLIFSTYMGGASPGPTALAIDNAGSIWLSGITLANQLPPASGTVLGTDYLAQLSPDGTSLTSVTTVPSGAAGSGIAIMSDGTIAGLGSSGSLLLSSATDTPSVLGVAASPARSVASAVTARELITLYGIDLSPVTAPALIANGEIARSLGGVQLLFDGVPAALLYVSSNQINAIVPSSVSGRLTTSIQIVTPSGSTAGPTLAVRDTAPQLFTTDSGYAVALNQDGSINAPLNRAQPGTVITIWFTGGGGAASTPDSRVNANSSGSLYPVSVIGGNKSLEVLYAGDAPGAPSGVMQVNFRLEPTPEQVSLDYLLQVGSVSTRFFVNAID